jgi:argininosuccinate synthase
LAAVSLTNLEKAQMETGTERIDKVVLAYSGGLDTSVILKWLKETYNCEVICFAADVRRGETLR